MALKYISSPMISAAMNARSVSKPFAVMPDRRSMLPARSWPPDPTTKYVMPFLRLDALVEVVVTGEHDADVVLQEERLEHFAQAEVRAVPVA